MNGPFSIDQKANEIWADHIQSPSRAQDSNALLQGGIRVWDMTQHLIHGYNIKAGIGQWNVTSITSHKRQLRIKRFGFQFSFLQIHAVGIMTLLSKQQCAPALTATNI